MEREPLRINPAAINLGRAQERAFVAAFCDELAKAGTVTDEVIQAAAERAFCAGDLRIPEEDKRKLALRRGKEKLKLDRIADAIADVYEIAAGFDLGEALVLHVAHIKGTMTRDQISPSGEVLQVTIPPNYQALRDYLKMMLPSAPTRVHIDKRSEVILSDGRQPSIDPLTIEAVIE